jgi:hypothetical protein
MVKTMLPGFFFQIRVSGIRQLFKLALPQAMQ